MLKGHRIEGIHSIKLYFTREQKKMNSDKQQGEQIYNVDVPKGVVC